MGGGVAFWVFFLGWRVKTEAPVGGEDFRVRQSGLRYGEAGEDKESAGSLFTRVT